MAGQEDPVIVEFRTSSAVLAAIWLPVPASAQTARATGTVRDIDGKRIKARRFARPIRTLQPRRSSPPPTTRAAGR